ncbi:MAG TPA: SCO family protein [Gammaproteobacteria bacterium]|nr:SCO family protein [Gammaproteobacteria bacterium]
MTRAWFLGAVLLAAQAAAAPKHAPSPGVEFDPPLGERIAVDAQLVDEDGAAVALGGLLGGTSLVVPLYYRCPNLCDLTLEGVAELAAQAGAARPADIVLMSFAADETPADARASRAELAARHPEIANDRRWHFLTASPAAIERVTRSLGFRFEPPAPGADMYSHAAGLVVVAADGTLLDFLSGVRFDPARLAALAAGRPAARAPPPILLWCFDYDPHTGRYTVSVLRTVRAASVLGALALAAGVLLMTLRRRRGH